MRTEPDEVAMDALDRVARKAEKGHRLEPRLDAARKGLYDADRPDSAEVAVI